MTQPDQHSLPGNGRTHMNNEHVLMTDPTVTPEAEMLAGEILAKLALDAGGQPFADEPDAWAASDDAEVEVVSLGSVRFKIINADASDLARDLGAIDPEHSDAAAMVIELAADEDDGALTMGRYLSIEVAPSVQVVFMVWISHADITAPSDYDLGPQATQFDALAERQALLVQVFEGHDHD